MPACIVAFGGSQDGGAGGEGEGAQASIGDSTYLGKNVDIVYHTLYTYCFSARYNTCPPQRLVVPQTSATGRRERREPNRSRPPALSLTSTGCFFYYLFSTTTSLFFLVSRAERF